MHRLGNVAEPTRVANRWTPTIFTEYPIPGDCADSSSHRDWACGSWCLPITRNLPHQFLQSDNAFTALQPSSLKSRVAHHSVDCLARNGQDLRLVTSD
jgi:hypothetical protein